MQSLSQTKLNVPPAVVKYMQQLELVLKQMQGVSPEDALCDAREFLLADGQALARSGDAFDTEMHYNWIVSHFGSPEQVARQYSSSADPPPPPALGGMAPGWRICCTHCGRSSPLAAIGGVRIGAYSYHKYKACYCSACNCLRWCRIIKDLDDTNLTRLLCSNLTAEQMRAKMHMSAFKLVGGILLSIAAIQLCVWTLILIWWK